MKPQRGRRFKEFAAVLAILVLAGVVFEQMGRRQDRRRYAQIGKSVDIGGRTLNIFCSGEGGPAVVFDTFGHASGYGWSGVQREAAKFTRACWYDRAGYGWSDPGPAPRTFQSVAADLRTLLRAAGVQPPYVLVGGGDAALHMRVYHGAYPGEVAGVVMVNANDVDEASAEIPEAAKGAWAKHFGSSAARVRGAACMFWPLLGATGVTRVANLFGRPRRTASFGLSAEQQAELDVLSDNATAQQGSELCWRETSMAQVRAAGDLGAVPLVVLVSDARLLEAETHDRVEAAWNRYRVERVPRRLAALSSRSRLVVMDGELTGDAVVRAIRQVMAMGQGLQ